MKRLQALAILVLVAIVLGGGFYLLWRFDLRWRPRMISKNAAEIGKTLEAAGWVSPGLPGPKLYIVAYRDCELCNRYEASEFPVLQRAGVDTRVIVIARADRNGQPRSTPAERSTVAELWVNRNWDLFQSWFAVPSGAWTAAGIKPADGDVARSSVVEAGRDTVDKLRALLKTNAVPFHTPLLIWWTKNGTMEACACREPQAWAPVRHALGVN
jgi:hypothetical protein